MRVPIVSYGLLACFVLMTSPPKALCQDEVIFKDPSAKKELHVVGTIDTESAASIVIKLSGHPESRTIPASDVVDVIYQVPPLARPEYRAARNREAAASNAATADERRRELTAALRRYEQLAPKLSEGRSRRHAEFKIATFQVFVARADRAQLDLAIEHLNHFKSSKPSSWQISRCANLLGKIQQERHDWDGARRTYEELRATADLPAEVVRDCDLKIAQAALRAGKLTEAERKLADLAKAIAPDCSLGYRIRISLTELRSLSGQTDEAVRSLENLVFGVADPQIKAEVYNALGDCHRRAKKPREALWNYLWVDVIYHQDPEEHARALYHLSQLFREFGDDDRAAQYRDRLDSDPRFVGIIFPR
jgi:tetratricopeptide (TPR) repeat protein